MRIGEHPQGEGNRRVRGAQSTAWTPSARMIAYGVTLGYDDCFRADVILGKLRFSDATGAAVEA